MNATMSEISGLYPSVVSTSIVGAGKEIGTKASSESVPVATALQESLIVMDGSTRILLPPAERFWRGRRRRRRCTG